MLPAASDADIAFMSQATEICLEEIRLSEVALEKGKKPEIRELGKKLTTEHYKSLLDLTALAARKSIAIPIGLGDKENMDYEKLNHMSGTALDREYAAMMVSEHRDAIVLFENESTGATDPDIRQWAAATLPEMHTHLDHAIAALNVLPLPGDSASH
jgi:putative membrane protein